MKRPKWNAYVKLGDLIMLVHVPDELMERTQFFFSFPGTPPGKRIKLCSLKRVTYRGLAVFEEVANG